MHKIVPYITVCDNMQMPGILCYVFSRKRPTVITKQENEDTFHLDTPGKSSSEAVKDIQPMLLLVRQGRIERGFRGLKPLFSNRHGSIILYNFIRKEKISNAINNC